MKTRFVSLLLGWLFSVSILVADDFIVVVDATRSMNGYLGKQGVKHQLVQKALVAFLKDLPEKNQRVYIYFFNDGFKETDGNEGLFNFKKNDPKDKVAAIAYAEKYGDFIQGAGTHLWSSFEKVLTFAEDNEFVKLDADGNLIKAPNIVLLTDGGDDQKLDEDNPKAGGWVLKKDPKQPAKPAILDQKEHQWLKQQKRANLIMVGLNGHDRKVLVKAWSAIGPAPIPIGGKIPRPFFPPTIVLTDGMGNDTNTITAGEPVTMKAQGAFDIYRWAIKDQNNKNILAKPLEGNATDHRFEKAGTYTIEVNGTMAENKQGAIGFKDIVVTQDKFKIIADFSMKHGDNVFQDKGVVWMGDKPAVINFDPSKTKTDPAGKVVNFDFNWTIKDDKGNPLPAGKGNDANFTVGGVYTIELNATDPKTKQSEVAKKTFTLWQVKPAFAAQFGGKPLPDGETAWMGDKPIKLDFMTTTTSQPPLDKKQLKLNHELELTMGGMKVPIEIKEGAAMIPIMKAGNYTVTLKATDDKTPGNILMAKQNFIVKQAKPLIKVVGGANAGGPLEVKLGDKTSFMWTNYDDFPIDHKDLKGIISFGDGNSTTMREDLDYQYKKISPPNKPLKAHLTVTLPGGETAQSNELLVQVQPTVVKFRVLPEKPLLGEMTELINLNKVPSGTTFEWRFGPNPEDIKRGDAVKHRFTSAGLNKVTLIISRPDLPKEELPLMIDIQPINPAPTLAGAPQDIYIGSKLLFEDKSGFPDKATGLTIKREWNLGDLGKWKVWPNNSDNTSKSVAIYYTQPGEYQPSLTVTLMDQDGKPIPGIQPIAKTLSTKITVHRPKIRIGIKKPASGK